MTEKEILQQQEVNEQKAFYLIAVGMFYHAYGNGAFALARATGYRVLRKHRKHGDILTCGFPANQLEITGSLICSPKIRTEKRSQRWLPFLCVWFIGRFTMKPLSSVRS